MIVYALQGVEGFPVLTEMVDRTGFKPDVIVGPVISDQFLQAN